MATKKLMHSSSVMVRRSERILRQRPGMVRSAAFRRRALILLKTCSIGYLAFESSADVRGRQSARSCSLACKLFKGDIMSFEKSPDCGAAAWELLAHRNQGQEPFGVLLQRRRASSTRLCA